MKIPLDRRAYLRLNVTLDVSYKLKQIESLPIRSLGKDIALGGIRLFIQEELGAGTLLDLAIKVPGYDETCEATGEVIWNKKIEGSRAGLNLPYYITGIKFIEIDLSKFAAIIAHCRSAEDEPGGIL